ncbi:putative glycosyl hydrolase [Escherichia coli]|uniref:Putative glycosyl hydrolase n=1 Tax=Escherichia coli TaxID=562 RepID=A0A377C8N7_ECOLX|nr:putative glycosyl hydrolase [Escherichia coli]
MVRRQTEKVWSRWAFDCFKTDFGERIPTDVQWFDGSDPQKMHNHYAYIYNELVWNVPRTPLVRKKRLCLPLGLRRCAEIPGTLGWRLLR